MKSIVKKRILVFICVLTFGASLLSGCGSKISDPWLDKWQEVVVDRSAEIEKAEVHHYRGIFSSIFDPEPQTTYDAKQISDMLDALYAPMESFYMATESEETGKKDTSHNKIHEYLGSRYQIDFYIRGEAEPFTVKVVLRDSARPNLDSGFRITDYISTDATITTYVSQNNSANTVSKRPAVIIYEIDEDSALQSEEPADFDALKNMAESILNNK